jgi:hypothetical protein
MKPPAISHSRTNEAPVVALAGLHAQPHEALRLALVLGPQPQFAPAHLEDLLDADEF